MGFSADPVEAELVAVVVVADVVVGSVVDEQLAINRAAHAANAAMLMGRRLRQWCPSPRELGTSSAWETLILDITASAVGFRADNRLTMSSHV